MRPRRAPTNHLDLDAVCWLSEYLSGPAFRADSRKVLVVASHDQDFLDEVCTDLVLLEDRALEYHRGGLRRLRAGRAARAAKRLKDYETQQKALRDERKAHPNLTTEKLEDKVRKKLHVDRLVGARPAQTALCFDFASAENRGHHNSKTQKNNQRLFGVSLRDVAFRYDETGDSTTKGGEYSSVAAFAGFVGLSFDVTPSTRSAVVGRNGTGKSTLLKLVAGELAPTSGERYCDPKIRVGFYDQHFSELADAPTTGRTRRVSAVQLLRERFDVDEHDARATLGRFGLDGARHLIPLAELSGGQKARVVFAALALKRPHVLILDEPTNHLDLESVDALVEGIRRFRGGVIAVSHDAALVDALARDEDGVEQPLFVCSRSSADAAATVKVEPGGFQAYRRRLQREQLEREGRINAAAEARAAARRRRLLQKKQGAAAAKGPTPPPRREPPFGTEGEDDATVTAQPPAAPGVASLFGKKSVASKQRQQS